MPNGGFTATFYVGEPYVAKSVEHIGYYIEEMDSFWETSKKYALDKNWIDTRRELRYLVNYMNTLIKDIGDWEITHTVAEMEDMEG